MSINENDFNAEFMVCKSDIVLCISRILHQITLSTVDSLKLADILEKLEEVERVL